MMSRKSHNPSNISKRGLPFAMSQLRSARSRQLLLSGASLLTLFASQPSFAQTVSGIRGTPSMSSRPGAPANGAPVTTLPPTAQAALNRQNAIKARTATAMDLANQAQSAARAAALAKPSTTPNGLVIGGLVPAGAITTDPSLWQNANAPTQTVGTDGKTTVEIDQTASKAILTWDSFNVGKDTTVYFNQSKGNEADGSNEWIALNRINDPSLAPSRIEGMIKAEGSVYLINRNGIIFSGTSQVNTHSLIVSSLSFFGENQKDPASIANTNKLFLDQGLSGSNSLGGDLSRVILGSGVSSAIDRTGDVTIEAGAEIETKENGFSLFAAPTVSNAGSIVSNGGQTVLAAAGGLQLSNSSGTTSNFLNLTSVGRSQDSFDLTNTGIVTALRGNISMLGKSILLGSDIVHGIDGDVEQHSIVLATSSIQQPGSISILGAAPSRSGLTSIVLAPDSLTAILPDANGGTTTTSAAADAAFKPGSATISADRGSVWLQQNSTVYMPGATLNISAPGFDFALDGTAIDGHGDGSFGRIQIDEGVVLSVAGLADIQRPMSDNLVDVARLGQNELADSPLQRDGILYKSPFTVDGRDSGTRDDGLSWVGTPIANVTGYVQNQTRTINDMLVNGGTINLAASGDLIVKSGSLLDVDGGFTHYLGGSIATSRLIGADGRVYDAKTADPMMTYVGFAGQTTVDHSRWGVTDNYSNSLMNGGYESDYVDGGKGGTLNTFSGGTTILNGQLSGQTVIGRHQIASGDIPQGATLNLGNFDLLFAAAYPQQASQGAAASFGGGYLLTKDGFSLDSLGPDFGFDSSIRTPEMLAKDPADLTNILHSSILSTDMINAGGFTNVSVTGTKAPVTLAEGASIVVQPGGSIKFTGAGITILGDLKAPAGDIELLSKGVTNKLIVPNVDGIPDRKPGDIVIGETALLDASGQWVNDTGVIDGQGKNFISGGSVSIQTAAIGANEVQQGNEGAVPVGVDLTGAILVRPGSVINVSSGGYVDTLGQLLTSDGVPVGMGGNVTIGTYVPTKNSPFVSLDFLRTSGRIELGGTLLGFGFSGGGTLSLQALSIQIGGDSAGLPDYTLYLPGDYFADQGFGAYNLSAAYDATIAAGTTVLVSQRNYVADLSKLARLATGSDITSIATPGTLDPYHRQATDFSLVSGGYQDWQVTTLATPGDPLAPIFSNVTGTTLLDEGASIQADAGASVTLASEAHVTVLGSIIAKGGAISLEDRTSRFSQANPFFLDHGVWLGADAVLDASGTTLTDPFGVSVRGSSGQQLAYGGRVLDGGSVSLTAVNGYVVAEQGSRIDASGTTGAVDVRGAGGRYSKQTIWSNGGTITLGATNGLFFDGTLRASGGAPQALGGTLILSEVNDSTSINGTSAFFAADSILLQGSGLFAPDGAQPGDALGTSHIMHFAVDRLDGSGIDTLILGADTLGDAQPHTTRPSLTIGFVGDVNLSLDRAVIANASNFILLPDGATSVSSDGTNLPGTSSNVTISASYVSLGGNYYQSASSFQPVAAPGGGKLTVDADTIDLTGRFNIQNVSDTLFRANGDIRLYTPAAYLLGRPPEPGMLVTGGNLTFEAAQLYPATANAFVLAAPTAGSTITFLGNDNASPLPLSVGGALLVDAETIVQDGTLRAPSGTIQLGVGDPTDTDTIAAFGGLPLVKTKSVTLGDGSLTSVSLDNRSLPYGTTTDGTDWKLVINDANYTSADLTSAPQKLIGIAGDSVDLAKGSTIDLSGGGNVYAQEWVPGTGGSRDLLNAINTVYSTGATPQQVPLYADGRQVYAVIPGYSNGVAAYDPSFGNAGSEVGKSVYLSGVKGLPDGYYTLLPGQYATVPGAFRVVQETQVTDSISTDNYTQPDGSQIISGRFVDGLTGKADARTTSFLVQSADVWKQYSEYTITPADDYFPAQAEHAGTSSTRTPVDAGQLVLAAVNALTLDGQLKAQAAAKGRGAEVDISAQDIQIIGDGAAARDGYLQLDATSLSNLGAESLLIGGTRRDGTDGTTVNVAANSVVLSNDASSALTGPEIILVTKTDPTGTDPNAATGVLLEAGSVISAKGDIATPSTAPILIGKDGGASGDGALVRVSNGAPVAVIRSNVPGLDGVAGTSTGLLDIRAGASVNGGNSTILDATGDIQLAPGAVFTGKAVDVNANTVAFVGAGSDATPGGLVVDPALLAQFANIATLGLHSRSTMDFYGDVSLVVGQNLTLGAETFTSDGGNVSITAPTLALVNDVGGSGATFAAGTGTLTLNAGELDLGTGAKTLQGFGAVTATATQGIVGQGTGSFDFGSLDVAMTAPVFTADTGANSSITTTGALTLNKGAGTATSRETLGGALAFTGGTLADNATIAVPAGNVSLTATSGDLTIGDGAMISTAGVAKPFRDVTAYAPGGKISLTANDGNILLAQSATLDFSGTAKGGDAGSLVISAPTQTAQLLGVIKGSAASGYQGGSFGLDIGGAVDLDTLAATLAASGVENQIAVHTRTGNLTLSSGNKIVASDVSLIADGGTGEQDPTGGNVLIAGTIDASGVAGGSITLAGKSGVTLTGSLLATGSAADQRGGTVVIETSGTPDSVGGVVQLDPTYGYEQVSAANSGSINIAKGAVIDVSGGTAGGLSGGTVAIRAPLLVGGDVNVTIDGGATIKGARDVGLEAYAVWSTADKQPDKTKYFDGIIDPAGWYNADGSMVSGSWTDQDGNAIDPPADAAALKDYLAKDIFTPDTPNADHQTFYGYQNGDDDAGVPGTLIGFIENPGFTFEGRFAGVANFHARPGVELRNPDPTINNGDISILTPWNLGAGTDPTTLAFRYHGQAPLLTIRALGNINVKASLSDGFWQYATATGQTGSVDSSNFAAVDPIFQNLFAATAAIGLDASFIIQPADGLSGDEQAIDQYYGLYQQYLNFLSAPNGLFFGNNAGDISLFLFSEALDPDPALAPPTLPTTANQYLAYLSQYATYYAKLDQLLFTQGAIPIDFVPPAPPPTTLDLIIPKPLTANGPAPQRTSANPLPLASATLGGGNSSTYRLVAGADLSAVDPLSVMPDANGGSLSIDGHLSWNTPAASTVTVGTAIRTGTGEIAIAAAGNFSLLDGIAPGTVYTAGAPATGTTPDETLNVVNSFIVAIPLLSGGEVHPEGAGDLSIAVGGNISGIQEIYSDDGNYAAQQWWPWLATANPADSQKHVTASSINFAAFGQGVMSVGGNVTITAGGDIREFSVSLPTTWFKATAPDGTQSVTYVGGGNLAVASGGDILGGSYFVSKGEGRITAGGAIGSAFTLTNGNFSTPVSTLLGLQDATLFVSARGNVDIGGIYNPSWLDIPNGPSPTAGRSLYSDGQPYSPDSSVALTSVSGDVDLSTMKLPRSFFSFGVGANEGVAYDPGLAQDGRFLPASINMTSLNGDIYVGSAGELYPSATGNLTLLAAGSIQFLNNIVGAGSGSADFGLSDAPASFFPSPLNPISSSFQTSLLGDRFFTHQEGLHDQDVEPVRIYSLTGDILDGNIGGSTSIYPGFNINALTLVFPKASQIYAGRDIVDLTLIGQNNYNSDVTSIVAGRDIFDTLLPTQSGITITAPPITVPLIDIAGPGYADIEAGRDIGPLVGNLPSTGIRAVGDLYNGRIERGSANVSVLFGVANGVAWGAFAAAYLDPNSTLGDMPSFGPDLVAVVAQYQADKNARAGGAGTKPSLTAEQAWAVFQTMPELQRQALIETAFFRVLQITGADEENPTSPNFGKYARGYQAINTLFPADLGYTKNNLEGGTNGATTQVPTGNLDIRGSTIQTQQGGDINIMGPGGQLLIGSTGSPPYLVDGQGNVLVGPQSLGILAWETGNVNIYSDASVLLAQSRIFTERGGSMTIWSSNGDINAGKGSKTSTEQPPLKYVCTPDFFCRIDSGGAVSGAGIAAFPPAPGDPSPTVTLVAPRGTVDFGDAGVRVAGNLIVAAQAVANADNVQVSGTIIGVPTNRANVALNLAASSTAANAAQEVANAMQQNRRNDRPSIITVTIDGFGLGHRKCDPTKSSTCTAR